ncbi:MAG TPA: type II toxin-antitoxin system VapC family toxin [Candidatus Kapabacteria bacterium]
MRLYLDANVIIYLIEAVGDFQSQIRARVSSVMLKDSGTVFTSRLSRLECRCKPVSERKWGLLAHYDEFFSRSRLLVLDINSEVIEQATALRAQYGLKSADAIHLASAILYGCDIFLAGDVKLSRCTEIPVEIV